MSKSEKLKEIARRTTEQGTRVWFEFWRQGVRHEIKAAACVTRDWPDKVGSEKWNDAAIVWGQSTAQAVCDRLDYEESPEAEKERAVAEYHAKAAEIEVAEKRRLEIETKYPDISDSADTKA
jgi:hypothetical protein